MSTLTVLTKRNVKLFFKDKGMFFTSLITPAILLVLYATFLANVYKESFAAALPTGIKLADKLMGGCVGAQLISSILAVSCVTVSFCSNMLMVQDKANGSIKDLSAYEQHDNSVTFVQFQSGAMGLNLQKANKIVYFSLPLSSEYFEQSKKRTHRIGQVRPCFYYIMLCRDSIEEKILETLKKRQDYTERLFTQ